MKILTRDAVYRVIDGEREYQEARWNGHEHEPAAYALFMQGYLNKAIAGFSTSDGNVSGLEMLRKVVALGVACFEENGVPLRIPPNYDSETGSIKL